jgi:hypothetical protein
VLKKLNSEAKEKVGNAFDLLVQKIKSEHE